MPPGAAPDIRQADANKKFFDLAELTHTREPLRERVHLAKRLDIGREPGKPVRRALLAIEHTCPTRLDAFGDRTPGVFEQGLHRANGLAESGNQLICVARQGSRFRQATWWLR